MVAAVFRRIVRWTVVLSLAVLLGVPLEVSADEQAEKAEGADARQAAPDLPTGGVKELQRYIAEQKLNRPRTYEQFVEIHTRIKAAADKILELEKDQKSKAYRQALELSLTASTNLIDRMSADEQRTALDRMNSYLATKHGTAAGLEVDDAQLAVAMVRGLEQAEAYELAEEANVRFAELFARSGDRQLAALSEHFETAARRLGLLGKEMELKGTTVDGEPFDIVSLKGKVVLVDFWATWCGPCVAEHPNIKEQYEKYKDGGFEVVGVSLDDDRVALERYLKEKETPWITLHERDGGGEHPAARRYGITAIPAMFLINADGKVLSLRARGEKLNELLASLFEKSPK